MRRPCTTLLIGSLVLLSSCTSQDDGARDRPTPDGATPTIAGTWMRPIVGQPDRLEGISFGGDGMLGLIGIHSMNGLSWRAEGDSLVITTNTGRYPEPVESRLYVAALSTEQLILGASSDYLAGTYERDDEAAGRIDGTVTYRQRSALPPQAAIHLTLADISRQDTDAVMIASHSIATQGRQVPIPFHIFYASADIDEKLTYGVRAVITVDGEMRFTTTAVHAVITRDAPRTVEIVVEPVQR